MFLIRMRKERSLDTAFVERAASTNLVVIYTTRDIKKINIDVMRKIKKVLRLVCGLYFPLLSLLY